MKNSTITQLTRSIRVSVLSAFFGMVFAGGGDAQTPPLNDENIKIDNAHLSDSSIILPVGIYQFKVTLTPATYGCDTRADNQQQSQSTEPCCCCDLEVESLGEELCKFQLTSSDFGPICCMLTLTNNWYFNILPNGTIELLTDNPLNSLKPGKKVRFRICAENLNNYITVCLRGYKCIEGQPAYCERCSDVIPASEFCLLPSSVDDPHVNNKKIYISSIFPNPSTHSTKIKLHLFQSGLLKVDLCDVSGNIIFTEMKYMDAGNIMTEMNTESLQSGVYLVRFTFSGII